MISPLLTTDDVVKCGAVHAAGEPEEAASSSGESTMVTLPRGRGDFLDCR